MDTHEPAASSSRAAGFFTGGLAAKCDSGHNVTFGRL